MRRVFWAYAEDVSELDGMTAFRSWERDERVRFLERTFLWALDRVGHGESLELVAKVVRDGLDEAGLC